MTAPPHHDEPPETRYSRQELLPGWRQSTLEEARLLVVGAGALGNEVLKNLALAGVGRVDVADFDVIELSNLSRCVLFREGDIGARKAEVAARRLRALNPLVRSRAIHVDIEHALGAGTLRGYDAVVGAVDSIAARLALNRLCRLAGVLLIDGGMDSSGGQVALFHPRIGACYECAMTAAMWARIAQRRGCLAQGAGATVPPPRLAATVTMASCVGAMVAQEVLRVLQKSTTGVPPLPPGSRACFGSAPYNAVVLHSSIRPDCAAHATDDLPRTTIDGDVDTLTGAVLLRRVGAETLSLGWDVVTALDCFDCSREEVVLPLFALPAEKLPCPRCGRVRIPQMQSTLTAAEPLARHTLRALGVPPLAVLEISQEHAWQLLELTGSTSAPCPGAEHNCIGANEVHA